MCARGAIAFFAALLDCCERVDAGALAAGRSRTIAGGRGRCRQHWQRDGRVRVAGPTHTPESAALPHTLARCVPVAEASLAPLRGRREGFTTGAGKGSCGACGPRVGRLCVTGDAACGVAWHVWGLPKKRSCLGFFFSGSGANCVVRVCPRPFPNSPLSAGMRAVRYGPLDGTSCPPLDKAHRHRRRVLPSVELRLIQVRARPALDCRGCAVCSCVPHAVPAG